MQIEVQIQATQVQIFGPLLSVCVYVQAHIMSDMYVYVILCKTHPETHKMGAGHIQYIV